MNQYWTCPKSFWQYSVFLLRILSLSHLKFFLFFQVQPSLISQLKTVRQMAISRLTEFFESMTDYDFRPIFDAIFSSAVWPQVKPYTGHM